MSSLRAGNSNVSVAPTARMAPRPQATTAAGAAAGLAKMLDLLEAIAAKLDKLDTKLNKQDTKLDIINQRLVLLEQPNPQAPETSTSQVPECDPGDLHDTEVFTNTDDDLQSLLADLNHCVETRSTM